MSHRFEVAGRTLYTWCAWDSLFLPQILGQEAEVESTCPLTAAEAGPRRLTCLFEESVQAQFYRGQYMMTETPTMHRSPPTRS